MAADAHDGLPHDFKDRFAAQAGEICRREVGYQVAETVDVDYVADDRSIPAHLWAWQLDQADIGDWLAHLFQGHAKRQVSRDGSEDISGVERRADFGEPILRVGKGDCPKARPTEAQFSTREIAFSAKPLGDGPSQDAVVRCDERSIRRGKRERAASAADAWIDDHDVDRARRKETMRLSKYECCLKKVLRVHAMANIDDLNLGIYAEYRTFDGANVAVVQTKIGCQRNHPSPQVASHKS